MQANESRSELQPDPFGSDQTQSARVTVIGIGNNLMTDDGAGVHVIEALRHRQLPEDVLILDGGTLSFTLLEEVEQAGMLIIADAAELHASPGTIRMFRDQEMDVYLGNSVRPSVHEVNLLDVLTAARIRGRMPARYALVGIQPAAIGWGTEPSATVAAAVEQAATMIEALIEEHLEAEGEATSAADRRECCA